MNLGGRFDEAGVGVGLGVGGEGGDLMGLTAGGVFGGGGGWGGGGGGLAVRRGFGVRGGVYGGFWGEIDWRGGVIGEFDFGSPEKLREQCAELRGRLKKVRLPLEVEEGIRMGMGQWGERGAFA